MALGTGTFSQGELNLAVSDSPLRKSRLLLPEAAGPEEPSAADLAADLAARLQHLEAIRRAGAGLMTRDKLGTECFARGMP